MSYQLLNNTFQFVLHPDRSTWDLLSLTNPRVQLRNIRMSLQYRYGYEHIWALEHWGQTYVGEPEIVTTAQGRARQITMRIGPDRHQIEYRVSFALPEQEPVLMWKVRILNRSYKPVKIEQIELLNIGFINISHGTQGLSLSRSIMKGESSNRGTIHFSASTPNLSSDYTSLAFYSNGWQSWSYSGAYQPTDTYKTTRLGILRRAMIENPTTSRPKHKGIFRSDMFGVLGNLHSRTGILAGFLSQRNHFGSLEAYLDPINPALRMWASGDGAQLDPGDEIETDWACLYHLQLNAPDPLGPYLEAVTREHGMPPTMETTSPSGWCSWYYFSDRTFAGTITPQAIRENAISASKLHAELPLDILQIDDGFEKNIGDWFDFKPDFSQGVAPLSADIRQSGLIPGLWLAPFIVHPKSELYHQHPDWLLRNHLHRPVNAGFCWNAMTTALDLTHPAALDYCQQVVHRAVHEWGYDYLKLDFLYAAALPGKFHDPHKTRAQVLRSGLEALRAAAGSQATILGCGCPVGPAIGLVDSMRIGTDTFRSWYPSFQGIKIYYSQDVSVPSARNSIQNALTRSPMHKRWWINDPDCLLVRLDSQLTQDEIQTIASVIALTGGSLFLSDDLPKLPPQRLRIAQNLLPLIDKRPYLLDWIDHSTPSLLQLDLTGATGSWSLLGIFNWQDDAIEKVLHLNQTYLDPNKKYLAREFWSGKLYRITDGQLPLGRIPAHGVCLLAIHPLPPIHPIYAGSNLHISQGMEVAEWQISDAELTFRIDRPGKTEGVVDIFSYNPPKQVTDDMNVKGISSPTENVYRLEVEINNSSLFTIQW